MRFEDPVWIGDPVTKSYSVANRDSVPIEDPVTNGEFVTNWDCVTTIIVDVTSNV